jgi:hypothetical protein
MRISRVQYAREEHLQVTNQSSEALHGVILCLSAPAELYKLQYTALPLPLLAPSLVYPFQIRLRCDSPESGASGELVTSVLRKGSGSGLITQRTLIPISEVEG